MNDDLSTILQQWPQTTVIDHSYFWCTILINNLYQLDKS